MATDSSLTQNYSRSQNSLETVYLPDSEAAVPINPMAWVVAVIVRLPENPSIAPNDPRSAFLLIISDDPVPVFPLTIPDDPDAEEGDHNDLLSNNRTVETKFGRIVKPRH
ncbi:hypothetical protein TNCV_1108881 [Trichonephila clavipes]|nr:hypothetical protein TNCV_1108881 [Trichonephila clavipes]